MKQLILIALVLSVAACGRADRFKGNSGSANVSRGAPVAFGPISKACMASDRKARSRALCGCIQYAANQTLSGPQQRRAVAFYGDPHRAQEIRQSDRINDESFWKAYRAYGDRAEAMCR
jgi:hypothetical protein